MNTLLAILLMGIALAVPPAWAEEENAPANTIELNKLTCKQMMAGNDLERDVLLSFYHGYMEGKKQVEIVDIAEASAISDKVREYCLSNPTNTVMETFVKFYK